MLGYLFLAIAIVTEVIATTFLKFTSGENAKWWAWVIVAAGYIVSFVALSQSLSRGVPLGVAYAIWSAVGVVLIVGALTFFPAVSLGPLVEHLQMFGGKTY